jgi:hypothetical protein
MSVSILRFSDLSLRTDTIYRLISVGLCSVLIIAQPRKSSEESCLHHRGPEKRWIYTTGVCWITMTGPNFPDTRWPRFIMSMQAKNAKHWRGFACTFITIDTSLSLQAKHCPCVYPLSRTWKSVADDSTATFSSSRQCHSYYCLCVCLLCIAPQKNSIAMWSTTLVPRSSQQPF